MKALRNAKATFFRNVISNAEGNTKEIWTNIKKMTKHTKHTYGNQRVTDQKHCNPGP